MQGQYPIETKLQHSKRETELNLKVEEGKVSCLYGVSESGKSELLSLFQGVKSTSFKGKCEVSGRDLLGGDPFPYELVGVSHDEDYLE